MRSTPMISFDAAQAGAQPVHFGSLTALSALSANSSVSMPMGKVASRQVP